MLSFSPLLILFMVKFQRKSGVKSQGFSPLLILFMVKFRFRFFSKFSSFSPLLILFMVKFADFDNAMAIEF